MLLILCVALLSTSPSETPIERLIFQLSSNSFETRRIAFEELKKRDCLPILKKSLVNEKLDKEIRESCRRLIEYYCWHSMGNGDNYPSIWYLPAEVRYVVENDFTVDNSSKWYNVYYAIKYPTHRSVFYSSSEVATYATKLFLSDAIFSEKITKKEAFEIIRKMQHNENECYLKGNWETPYLMLRQPIKNRGRSQP